MARIPRSALLAPVALASLALTACAGPRYADGGAYHGGYADGRVVVDERPLPFDPRPLPPNTAPGDCVTPLADRGDYRWALIDCTPAYAQSGYGYGQHRGGGYQDGGYSRYYETGGERHSGYGAYEGYSQSGAGYSYGAGRSSSAPPYSYSSGYAYGPGYNYSYGHDPRAGQYSGGHYQGGSSGIVLGGPMSGGVGHGYGWESYGYGGYGYGQGVSGGGYGYPPAWGGYRTAGRDAYGYLVWPNKR